MIAISSIYKDPIKRRKWIETHQSSLKAWIGFFVTAIIIFFVFSDGDFSFLLTLSSFIGMFTFLMVIFNIEKAKTSQGVSLKMFDCYVVLLFFRLFSIVFYEGYLPYDRTGDWLYQTIEGLTFIFASTISYLCRVRYADSYDRESDRLNPLYLIIPSFLISLLIHPALNASIPADISWTFALFLETTSCLPQLFMFQKQQKVEPFTTHFLAGQALSKVVSFLFWLSCYSELNDPTRKLNSYVGIWVIVMQVIQLLVMGDFIHHYIRCVSRGVPVEFLLTENV